MHNNDRKFIVQKIRTQYVERENKELDELRELDRKVKLPANVFAYTFGTVGALVLGAGMSLAMKVIGDAMGVGIVIGIIGIGMVASNYFITKKILNSRKKKYAEGIIALSEKIIGENEDSDATV